MFGLLKMLWQSFLILQNKNISLQKNIFENKELEESSVVKENLTTTRDGKNYKTKIR